MTTGNPRKFMVPKFIIPGNLLFCFKQKIVDRLESLHLISQTESKQQNLHQDRVLEFIITTIVWNQTLRIPGITCVMQKLCLKKF